MNKQKLIQLSQKQKLSNAKQMLEIMRTEGCSMCCSGSMGGQNRQQK